MNLSATLSDRPDGVQLLLRGEVDYAVRDGLRLALRSAIGRTDRIVEVDLRDVTFLDCAGVGAIVEAHQLAARAGRTLIVTRHRGVVRRVLDLSGVLGLLDPVQDPPNLLRGLLGPDKGHQPPSKQTGDVTADATTAGPAIRLYCATAGP